MRWPAAFAAERRQGFQVSVDAARAKLASLDRLARNNTNTGPVNIGMPITQR